MFFLASVAGNTSFSITLTKTCFSLFFSFWYPFFFQNKINVISFTIQTNLFRRHKRCEFNPWVRKIPWRRAWQPTPLFLPGEILWTEEPGGLQSRGSQRVGHDWSNLACTYAFQTLSFNFYFFIHRLFFFSVHQHWLFFQDSFPILFYSQIISAHKTLTFIQYFMP